MKKSYFFYAFVLIFVSSVYYFDYYKGEETKKKKDEASILIPFEKDQVSKIELKQDSEEIQLVKVDKVWKLAKPIEDLADENTLSDWLNSLTSEKNTDSLGEGEVVNWAAYGLDKPKATVVVYKATGEKVQIDLSARKNFEGSSFLRKDQGPLALVATSAWQSLLQKNVQELRDKRIFRASMADIESVNFKGAKEPLSLQNKEGLWFITGKLDLKLSQNLVREVVNAISEMRAQEFSVDLDPNQKQIIDYGLNKPILSAELKFKDAKVWTAVFGQNKDKSWFVWPKDLHKVLKIDNAQIDKILKASVDSLRDREAPFVFAKEEIKKVSIQLSNQPTKSMELSKEGDKWKSSLPGQVDEKELSGLFNRLSELRVGEFLDGKAKTSGIDPAQRKIVLSDAEGKSIWSMAIGDGFKKKIAKNENQYFYVKTSVYGDIVAVADSGINNLPLEKIMKEAESKPTEPKSNDLKDGEKSKDKAKGSEAP